MFYANRTVSFLLEMGELAFYNDWDAIKVSKVLNPDGRILKDVIVYCNWMREKIKALYDMKHPRDANKERNYRQILDDSSLAGGGSSLNTSKFGSGQYITIEVDKSIPTGKEHRMAERRKKIGNKNQPDQNTINYIQSNNNDNNSNGNNNNNNNKDQPNLKI